jgi:protein SCO1/2
MTKAEAVTWSVVAVALAGVVALAALSRRPVASAPSGTAPESAGQAPEKTSELFDEPAGELGDLPCVERSGRAMRTSELRGKFVVLDFIFTNCPGTCPAMTSQMAALQDALKSVDDVRLASFSVDPERDTPAALSTYADRYKADKEKWLFFRCDPAVIAEIGRDRIKLWPDAGDVGMHSSLVALLDRQGRVRALYSALHDEKWIPKLLADVEKLRREPVH